MVLFLSSGEITGGLVVSLGGAPFLPGFPPPVFPEMPIMVTQDYFSRELEYYYDVEKNDGRPQLYFR